MHMCALSPVAPVGVRSRKKDSFHFISFRRVRQAVFVVVSALVYTSISTFISDSTQHVSLGCVTLCHTAKEQQPARFLRNRRVVWLATRATLSVDDPPPPPPRIMTTSTKHLQENKLNASNSQVVHWAWHADGWASPYRLSTEGLPLLAGCGAADFAGSAVVHMVGGVAALVAAKAVKPRRGRFVNGRLCRLTQQSPALQTLGTLILWVGWCECDYAGGGVVNDGGWRGSLRL